jgi:hypothetical protein
MWSRTGFRACWTLVFVTHFGLMAHAQEQSAQAAPEAAEDWLERGELTGDWDGGRTKLKSEGGTTLEISLTLEPLIRTRDEHGLELFYRAPVGWSRVTADLQVIDPFLVRSETRAFSRFAGK